MNVFVVTTHYETGDNAATTTVNGVFTSMDKATEAMKNCLAWEKDNNFAFDFEDGCEMEVNETETYCSILNTEDNVHYVSINITETGLQ